MPESSAPPAVTMVDTANLTDAVWDGARLAPDRVLFIRRGSAPAPGGGGRQPGGDTAARTDVTCRQFCDEVIALARGLVAAGVAPGTRVVAKPGPKLVDGQKIKEDKGS